MCHILQTHYIATNKGYFLVVRKESPQTPLKKHSISRLVPYGQTL